MCVRVRKKKKSSLEVVRVNFKNYIKGILLSNSWRSYRSCYRRLYLVLCKSINCFKYILMSSSSLSLSLFAHATNKCSTNTTHTYHGINTPRGKNFLLQLQRNFTWNRTRKNAFTKRFLPWLASYCAGNLPTVRASHHPLPMLCIIIIIVLSPGPLPPEHNPPPPQPDRVAVPATP